MIARTYRPEDVAELKELFSGDVDRERDVIAVVEIGGKIAAAVAMRPCLFLHDFVLPAGALKRQITDCLMAYASGAARAMGHREAIVIVSDQNPRMQAWWEEHGAKQMDPGSIYTMEIQ